MKLVHLFLNPRRNMHTSPWRAIKPHLLDVLERAREYWPAVLNEAYVNPEHRSILVEHWKRLHKDFQL